MQDTKRNSQNKSQKVFTPSTALIHNYQFLKYEYVNDYSQAHLSSYSTAELIADRLFTVKSLCCSLTGSHNLPILVYHANEDEIKEIRLCQSRNLGGCSGVDPSHAGQELS
ncbi:hypothetical protein TNCV_1389761 [Trichonephila clavipes]|nr:hypothetical protein TNCV_1389761 [Trichonephila clavipes]